ncbi:MAG: Hpt domain-containing protein [Caulobacteraceae bacterium]|nr:Hpt domain-containing protein [Caulobacter sp.]
MARRDLTGAVDFAHLETYAGHDMALVEEVLDLFAEQVAGWGRLLDPDGGAWRDAAHSLKGSALGVGAFRLAQACDAAETAGAAAGPVERARLTEAVRTEADRALADVAAYRHQRLLDDLRGDRR